METSVSKLSSSASDISSTVANLTSQVNRMDTLVGSVNSTVLSSDVKSIILTLLSSFPSTERTFLFDSFLGSKPIGLWHMAGKYHYKQVETFFHLLPL